MLPGDLQRPASIVVLVTTDVKNQEEMMWLYSQIPVFIFLSVAAVVLYLEIPPVTFKGNVSRNSIALEWTTVVC